MSRIFLTGIRARAARLNSAEDASRFLRGEAEVPVPSEYLLPGGGSLSLLSPEIPADHAHYPSRKDLKVMRQDSVAAVVAVGELLDEAPLGPELLARCGLFLANGVCLDGSEEEIAAMATGLVPLADDETVASRLLRTSRATHPLMALKMLTNATQCFVAQKSLALGPNTTFGNTSHSAIDALETSIDQLRLGACNQVIAGASSDGGVHSWLYHRHFTGTAPWREATGAAFVLLENEEGLRASGHRPLAELTALDTSPGFAWNGGGLLREKRAGAVCFNGPICESGYAAQRELCLASFDEAHSFFPSHGFLGTCGPFLSLLAGVALLRNGHHHAHAWNRDVYGREALLRLEAP